MTVRKINGVWVLTNEKNEFLYSLLGQNQPKTNSEALELLIKLYEKSGVK